MTEKYFAVISRNHVYKVKFMQDENVSPECECNEWRKTLLPCKHMIAIFESQNGYEYGWNQLPVSYTSSPYFNLDYDVINEKPSSAEVNNDIPLHDDHNNISKRTKGTVCREMLNQIKSMSYLVQDIDVMEDVISLTICVKAQPVITN